MRVGRSFAAKDLAMHADLATGIKHEDVAHRMNTAMHGWIGTSLNPSLDAFRMRFPASVGRVNVLERTP